MKNNIPTFIITWIFGVLTITHSLHAAAGWVDDWMGSATIDSPSSYENQKRGFYSAGGFRTRNNLSTDFLVSAQMPSLKGGCGGIDAFLGGVSFLDEDYLVKKFQNMLQAAPGVAFDIALKVMSKEASESMKSLEAAVNMLNNIQLDDCALTKAVITTPGEKDGSRWKNMMMEMTGSESMDAAYNKSYQQVREQTEANDGKPTIDLGALIGGCPTHFKAIVANGSMIKHTSTLIGMEPYADIIRGYIGDVEIRKNPTDKIPLSGQISACSENDSLSIDDMLYGKAMAKKDEANGGACYTDNTLSVVQKVENDLSAIVSKIKSKLTLTTSQEQFIENSPIPILPILKKAIAKNNEDMTVYMMSDLVATALTVRMFNDLYRQTDFIFRKVDSLTSQAGIAGKSSSGAKCKPELYSKPLTDFRSLQQDIWEFRRAANHSYDLKMKEQITHLKFAEMHKKEEAELRKKAAQNINLK